MDAPVDAFDAYLAPDERMEYVGPGTVVDDGDDLEGVIGVTDRRVLFASRTDGFLGFKHRYVASMRSRSRTTLTTQGRRARIALAVGVTLATVGFVGVLVSTRSLLALALALVGAGSLAAFEYVRRYDLDVDWERVDDAVEDRSLAAAFERRDSGSYSFGSNYGHLLVAFCVVGLTSFAWLGAVAEGALALLLAVVGVAGLALIDYSYRRKRTLDRGGESRRRQRELSVKLVDGRLLHLRFDARDALDRTLSQLGGDAPGSAAVTDASSSRSTEQPPHAEQRETIASHDRNGRR